VTFANKSFNVTFNLPISSSRVFSTSFASGCSPICLLSFSQALNPTTLIFELSEYYYHRHGSSSFSLLSALFLNFTTTFSPPRPRLPPPLSKRAITAANLHTPLFLPGGGARSINIWSEFQDTCFALSMQLNRWSLTRPSNGKLAVYNAIVPPAEVSNFHSLCFTLLILAYFH
jgi:hypothetical protein